MKYLLEQILLSTNKLYLEVATSPSLIPKVLKNVLGIQPSSLNTFDICTYEIINNLS